MISLVGLAVVIFFFLLIEAFFSGSEIAFFSASRAKILQKSKANVKGARVAKMLISKPESLFSTTVVGTTLAMTFTTTYTTLFLIDFFKSRPQLAQINVELINVVVLTPIVLIFGEFVPKMFARSKADTIVLKVSSPLYFSSFLLYPFTKLLSLYAQILKKILGETANKGFFLSREEIKAALPASQGSDVTQSERQLIRRILEFRKTSVDEILRPLIDVKAIEENKTISEAIKMICETGHSRIPVYRERIDNIVGIIQSFDCLMADNLEEPVKSITKDAYFVPESKDTEELLLELKSKPMAIAVNEFGGAEGIVTMEDVMEEIVGEIEDEYDKPPKLYHRIGENSFIVNARIEIDTLQEELGIPIAANDDYVTLAGFLLKHVQKIPNKWDSVTIRGIEYIVQSATDRSIEEVYIIVHEPQLTHQGHEDG